MNSTSETKISIPASDQVFVIVVYSTLLVIGALGNVGVLVSLLRSRRRKSRVNLLMTHLVIADMMVTLVVIPLEIGWRTTNAWLAGNLACKFFLVLRAFGLYLSSNVLVCISVDRFFAIIYPLRLAVARKRSKMMLYLAWMIALLCSLPQSLVFRVKSHPKVKDFQQCVSFEAFRSPHQELAYNIFCLSAMYFLPLTIITGCYICIFYEISNNSKENTEKTQQTESRVTLRRSDQRPLVRARRRTLRMTVTIVTVFACCWLPYATMTLWYMVDRNSAVHVSPRIQDMFFIMAVSNSCMDPLVYGSYAFDLRAFTKTFRKIFCNVNPTDIPVISNPHDNLKTKLPASNTLQNQVHRSYCKRYPVFGQTATNSRLSPNSEPLYFVNKLSSKEAVKGSRSFDGFLTHSPRREFNF
ncbi:adipokinetic hormone/corazonin-related peptide receptor variant I-like [Plodia interpunctella]|uniref:adipokinetic hormone/corazonin-related peptide receptor variant I-like n=1 Tax=Plodia interpunctella TaxID=58824 RepID=UPI00236765C2|nr:adipokinetic hormone/corazonin-related peptide receptor variant I-like [Plodia interpunctella]